MIDVGGEFVVVSGFKSMEGFGPSVDDAAWQDLDVVDEAV